MVLTWCADEAIDCLYFLADADDAATVSLAERHQFALVDLRVTLASTVTEGGPACRELDEHGVRPAREADIPALRAIARVSHRDSRFYFDGHFPESRCDALYETWIENSCRGYADAVLVAEVAAQPAGYISCHLTEAGVGQIGLVGVGERAQGRGLGRALVLAALGWFARHHAGEVSVVTQGRNVRAQRLYQRCGFVTQSVQLWYHRWFDARSER